MNQQYRNQFRPSFGMSPLYLAGRDEWIRSFHLGLFEPNNPIRASLVWGPRGIGKTVLLNEFEDIAALKNLHAKKAANRAPPRLYPKHFLK